MKQTYIGINILQRARAHQKHRHFGQVAAIWWLHIVHSVDYRKAMTAVEVDTTTGCIAVGVLHFKHITGNEVEATTRSIISPPMPWQRIAGSTARCSTYMAAGSRQVLTKPTMRPSTRATATLKNGLPSRARCTKSSHGRRSSTGKAPSYSDLIISISAA